MRLIRDPRIDFTIYARIHPARSLDFNSLLRSDSDKSDSALPVSERLLSGIDAPRWIRIDP